MFNYLHFYRISQKIPPHHQNKLIFVIQLDYDNDNDNNDNDDDDDDNSCIDEDVNSCVCVGIFDIG